MKGKQRPTPSLPEGSTFKRRLALIFAMLLACGGAWAFFEFVVWNRIPAALVGKWVVKNGPDEGGTIDFYRSGAMLAKVNQGGYEGIIHAQIRVEDNKIYVTTKHRESGKEGTRIQTIKTLEKNLLVVMDERGKSISLERAD